ncbi:LuxR C-terminal-related transcriptional regulator [Streptomyces phaeochromogenes]
MSAPLSADVLGQIRTAGLALPRPPYPGQGWTPLTGPEQHLLREGYRLDRVRQLLLAEIGRLRRLYADRAVQRSAAAVGPLEHPELCPLSHAELRALVAAASGEAPRETARRLLLTEDTVRRHRLAAQRRLGARSMPHAVAITVAARWITPEQIAGGTAP